MTATHDANLFLEITPAGAYYAAGTNNYEPARVLLLNILSEQTLPILEPTRFTLWSGLQQKESIELVDRLQKLGWLRCRETPLSAPKGPLEKVLPSMLEQVSIGGKALLADDQGFHLSSSGITHETAEPLSAVSANLGSLYDRYHRLLANNLGLRDQAWTISNAAGNSQLGFWPLYIGSQRFFLVVQGRPTFNQPAFRDLVWVLAIRYSNQPDMEDDTEND
jgi:hypothetical protein